MLVEDNAKVAGCGLAAAWVVLRYELCILARRCFYRPAALRRAVVSSPTSEDTRILFSTAVCNRNGRYAVRDDDWIAAGNNLPARHVIRVYGCQERLHCSVVTVLLRSF